MAMLTTRLLRGAPSTTHLHHSSSPSSCPGPLRDPLCLHVGSSKNFISNGSELLHHRSSPVPASRRGDVSVVAMAKKGSKKAGGGGGSGSSVVQKDRGGAGSGEKGAASAYANETRKIILNVHKLRKVCGSVPLVSLTFAASLEVEFSW